MTPAAALRSLLPKLFNRIDTDLSPHFSSRDGKKIKACVIHTTESGTNSIDGIVNYFNDPDSEVSAHYVVNDVKAKNSTWTRVVRMVWEKNASWTSKSANSTTINYELVGRAKRTQAEWLSLYRPQLRTAAALVAEDVLQYNIPIVHAYPGILGHGDLDKYGFPNDHWDPGKGFPWDEFLALVRYYVKRAKTEAAK